MPKVIRLTENQFSEMMAFHGTDADFDKFNHKKYLNTGAGSQAFGWGTYVSDDKYVALGYSEATSSKNENETIKANIYKSLLSLGANESVSEKKSESLFRMVRCFGFDKTINDINMSLEHFKKEYERHKRFDNLRDLAEEDLESVKEVELSLNAVKLAKDMEYKDKGFLYEVEIPDDNGENYISWSYIYCEDHSNVKTEDDYYKEKERAKNYAYGLISIIAEKMREIEKKFHFSAGRDFYEMINPQKNEKFNWLSGGEIYNALSEILGSEKAASLFLMQCGFDGIKYEGGTMWDLPEGAKKHPYNYVIFDANKVKIVNKTKV